MANSNTASSNKISLSADIVAAYVSRNSVTPVSLALNRVGVPSRFMLELTGASSGDMRLSDHAARSMI